MGRFRLLVFVLLFFGAAQFGPADEVPSAARQFGPADEVPPAARQSAIVAPPVAIAAAGDISCARGPDGNTTCRDKATSDLIMSDLLIARVLTLGDNQYENGTLSEYQTYFHPTWGRFKSRTKPATGNHDHEAGYYDYWGSQAGQRNRGYYAFDQGGWRLYAINSSIAVGTGSQQYNWLRQDLTANPRTCVIAYWHHPRWSSGRHGSQSFMDPIWDLLYDHGADVVLSGHDHSYERFAPLNKNGAVDSAKGIRQFVVGTGGKSLYAFGSIKNGSQVRNNTSYGILKLSLSATGYSWSFVRATGRFSDSGSGTCH